MEVHLTLAFSEEETKMRENAAYKTYSDDFDAIVSFKLDLYSFFMELSFINGIRFDLAGNTLVADVFVLPIIESTKADPAVRSGAASIQKTGTQMGHWPRSMNHTTAWRQFLPSSWAMRLYSLIHSILTGKRG
jgi:hypothetical protein